MRNFDYVGLKIMGFFKKYEFLGWATIFLSSACLLGFSILAAYYEITANRTPPIELGKLNIGTNNMVTPGDETFAYVPMKWVSGRSCSAYITISIRGEHGEIYQSPPPIYYSAEVVKKFVSINPDGFEFYVQIPKIARLGKAYVIGTPEYICDDNKSFIDRKISLSYVDTFDIVPEQQ